MIRITALVIGISLGASGCSMLGMGGGGSADDGMRVLAEQPDGTKVVALDELGVKATVGREVQLAESSDGTAKLQWDEVHENYALTHTVLLSVADREGETMDQAVSRLRGEYLGFVLGEHTEHPDGWEIRFHYWNRESHGNDNVYHAVRAVDGRRFRCVARGADGALSAARNLCGTLALLDSTPATTHSEAEAPPPRRP